MPRRRPTQHVLRGPWPFPLMSVAGGPLLPVTWPDKPPKRKPLRRVRPPKEWEQEALI